MRAGTCERQANELTDFVDILHINIRYSEEAVEFIREEAHHLLFSQPKTLHKLQYP